MDSIRTEENNKYVTAEADRELGLSGVQKALGVLRDYYDGASALIQDKQPAKHEAVKHHDLRESTPASIEKLVAAAPFVEQHFQTFADAGWPTGVLRRAAFGLKGKSTTTGCLIFELGGIPKRELKKLKAEADRLGKS